MNRQDVRTLIIDDDPFIRMALSEAVSTWGYVPILAETVATGEAAFNAEDPAVALIDVDLPDGSGIDLLQKFTTARPDLIAIIITGNVDVEHTVAALRAGAHDFIGKPVRLAELEVTLRNALETHTLRKEVETVRRQRAADFSFEQIIGESPAMKKVKELAARVADSDVASILLQGETGTGKDLFAKAIHFTSSRAPHAYLAINCAALPATLIESELFGFEKGAFTDAKQRKEGLFEQAQGGTIFLDEIGEMELSLQAKLLRVLENGVFRRVGGLKDIRMDSRIVAASNQDLRRAGEEGRFRSDLFFRLSVIQIDIPPLRDRGDDVMLLAGHYIDQVNPKRRQKPLKGLSPPVETIFRNYEWKGNVRELRNVIERASILEDTELVTTTHLPADMLSGTGSAAESGNAVIMLPDGGVDLEQVEFELSRQAMERTGGNLTQAARLLNISRDQLRYKLRKAGLYEELTGSDPGDLTV
ncbi:MAG TPA: sigma-54 dependent transcriptional regulator [Pyrinomonadaceae bacterium]|nr:sigma-54 dependent transcriptional regulator [Pyrinomonadaceae bacterium]HMP64656.1 sigma-54 dependent transcriptional regulator [Pyrinomonadaceae bacterium]